MMIQPIPRYFLIELTRHDRRMRPLEVALRRDLAAGRLKSGDQIATPEQLAETLHLSPVEVLESISEMLSKNFLRQNRNGDLFINATSVQALPQRPGQQVA